MLHRTRQYVAQLFKVLGSLLPGIPRSDATLTRVVRPWREDAAHSYPSVGLTPGRVLSFLQAADAGAPQLQFELFNEMLQKWPRLAAVENTRRLALTGLEWEIVPAARPIAGQTRIAEEAAAFCRETLEALDGFRDALDHLANALGYGIAVAELVWENGRLIDFAPVPYSRLVGDSAEPWRLRIRTETEPAGGVALDEHPFKWIIHKPRVTPGRHFEGGLLRASALLFLAQNLSLKDWLIYSQIAGMPVRVAQFEPGTPDDDKDKLLRMLERMGTDAVAVLSKNVELKFLEAAASGEKPYRPLQDYCNTEITILWLGQHLTTDVRASGSRAAAEIHDRVREDLLVDDMADEARTLRRDLLKPLAQARFGDGAPVPQFRRSLVQAVDTKTLADTLAVAVRQLGLAVPKQWAHRALGIPEPKAGEPVLPAEDKP